MCILIFICVVLKDPENMQFVPNHFKTQETWERAVKMLFYTFSYICDQCKTQRMSENILLEDIKSYYLSLINIKIKWCMKKILIVSYFVTDCLLHDTKDAIKLLIDINMEGNIFLINTRPRRSVTVLFYGKPLCYNIVRIGIKPVRCVK